MSCLLLFYYNLQVLNFLADCLPRLDAFRDYAPEMITDTVWHLNFCSLQITILKMPCSVNSAFFSSYFVQFNSPPEQRGELKLLLTMLSGAFAYTLPYVFVYTFGLPHVIKSTIAGKAIKTVGG